MKPSQQIDQYLATLTDWRGDMLSDIRATINAADPGLTETWKWNVPVWDNSGPVCAIGAFKNHVKINFFKGASLADQSMFNAGLDAKTSRSIDLFEGDQLNKPALQELIRSAYALNKA